MEHNHHILFYDSTKEQYEELIAALPDLFREIGIEDEVIEPKQLSDLMAICEETYFDHDMIPPYNKRDMEYLLKFFAQKESAPLFILFEEIDRKKVNLAAIAKEIVVKDMRRSEQNEYTDSLWDDEKSLLRIYFGNKYFFKRQLEIEIDKVSGQFESVAPEENVTGEEREITALSLYDICVQFPAYGKKLKTMVFEKAMTSTGEYRCTDCGKTSPHKVLFQIDHIIPMSKGGLTKLKNLQLLCRTCNRIKRDNQ
jgi:hypothetical protein